MKVYKYSEWSSAAPEFFKEFENDEAAFDFIISSCIVSDSIDSPYSYGTPPGDAEAEKKLNKYWKKIEKARLKARLKQL